MRRIFSNRDLRVLSTVLAVVLFIASAPLTAGVIIVNGPSHPELSVDICHPVQSADIIPGVLLARPAPALLDSLLLDFGSSADNPAAPPIDLRIAPDTPPPKFSA
jgi:hypothetical protein